MEKQEQIRRAFAKNLIYFRKEYNITQIQLAEKLNYSDKAVSKWERAESIPDVFVLLKISDMFNCTIDDLLSEKMKKKKQLPKNRFIISLMSVGLVWLVAVVVFMLWMIIGNYLEVKDAPYWITWFYAILASCIVALIFSKIWGVRWIRFIFVTGINWSTALIIYNHLILASVPASWLVWCVSAAVQVLIILWYLLIRKKKSI